MWKKKVEFPQSVSTEFNCVLSRTFFNNYTDLHPQPIVI